MSGIPAALQNFLNRNTWVALVATMLVGIAAVVFRPPTWVLDALVVINWASALALFGLVFRIESATKLASFPTILQLATTLRILALFAVLTNIVTTFEAGRLVTRLAPSFDREAMVATIMTLLLLVLMYKILLAKGSERIATVKARFSLDAMPGKQMSIDADLRAGAIDMREAQRRREVLQKEVQFSAAMEGAAKFINAEGNLVLIGAALGIVAAITGSQIADVKMFTPGEAAGQAAKLVGGAGLAVILPAIMMSLAMVILITRASGEDSDKDIGTEIGDQVLRRPIVLGMVGFTMLVAGVVMRNLFGALLVLGGAGAIMFAWKMMKAQEILVQSRNLERARLVSRGERRQLAPLTFELSKDLLAELGPNADSELGRAVEYVEQHVYEVLGVKIPQPDISIGDSPGCRLRLLLDENFAMEVELPAGTRFVPVRAGDSMRASGNRVLGDVVGRFVAAADVPDGVAAPGTAGVLPLAFAAAVLRFAHEFVDVTQVQRMLEQTSVHHRELVNQTVQDVVKHAELVELLKKLVKDQISIRDVRRILESVLAGAQRGLKNEQLLDYVRASLSRQITHQFAPDRSLRCIQVTRETDAEVEERQRPAVGGIGETRVIMPEARRRALEQDIREACSAAIERGCRPIILCRPEVRQAINVVARGQCPDVVVLAADELNQDVAVETVAWIGDSIPPASAGNE